MSEQEQPQHGGSFVRQKDGSLKRVEETPAEAPATIGEAIERRMDEARASKPSAGKASPAKDKKDK